MKIDVNVIINAILIIALCLLGWQNFKQNEMIDKQTVQLTSKNTDDNKSTTIVYEQKLESLKKINRDLYDSLKIYKDEIDYLVQFKYKKDYVIQDTITKIDTTNINEINEYTYSNKEKNDTLNYQLKIGSKIEPNWYTINFQIADKFTIVNKKINDINETTIAPSTNGNVSNVTVIKKKEKKSLLENISFGPSITAGYCLGNRNFDVVVGVSAVWKIK